MTKQPIFDEDAKIWSTREMNARVDMNMCLVVLVMAVMLGLGLLIGVSVNSDKLMEQVRADFEKENREAFDAAIAGTVKELLSRGWTPPAKEDGK